MSERENQYSSNAHHDASNLAARLIAWLPSLTVAQGEHAGEPFKVLPWQRRWIEAAFAEGVRISALSLGRANGKTTLAAGIAAAAMIGPLRTLNSETIIVAASFAQGRILWRAMNAFLDDHPDFEAREWSRADNNNNMTLRHRRDGVSCRVLASDYRRAHGLQAQLILADEPAQWPPSGEQMWAALRTGAGKLRGTRVLAIGTRSALGDHFFSRALQRRGVSMVWSAKDSDPPFDEATWRKANPSWDHSEALREAVRAEAAEAREDDQLLPGFLALRLNMGVAETKENYILDPKTWAVRCEMDAPPPPSGPYVLGLDLGGSEAMSAAAAYWPRTQRLEAFGAFNTDPSLAARAKRDGVGEAYEAMRARGELMLAGKHTVDVGDVLRETVRRWGKPRFVCADRWRQREAMAALEDARFPLTETEFRGMGFKDGGEDLRAFRRACLDGKVKTAPNLLLRSCIAFGRVGTDAAGNQKLTRERRGRSRTRDDAIAASILAVACALRHYGRARPIRPSGARRRSRITLAENVPA